MGAKICWELMGGDFARARTVPGAVKAKVAKLLLVLEQSAEYRRLVAHKMRAEVE